MDFLHGHRIEEALDEIKRAAESPGSVDQVQLAESFGVVVLEDGGGGLDVAVDGADFADADTLEVHDGAAGFEEAAGFTAAGWEPRVGEVFVLDY